MSTSSTGPPPSAANAHPSETSAQQTPQSGKPSSNSQNYHNLSYEERLPKIWRPLMSSIANCMSKAEKAGADSSQANCRELNESVVAFLRTRMEWHRLVGHVEAKLQGKAQEVEALEGYVRTQPRLGKRKRNQYEMSSAELQTAMQNVATTADTPTRTL